MAAQVPERLHTGDTTFLRPSDINQIISNAMIWVRNHPEDPRGYEPIGEVAASPKAIVMHFAQAAQAPVQRKDGLSPARPAAPQRPMNSSRARRCCSSWCCQQIRSVRKWRWVRR
ncbi:hypothetical protein AB0P40_02220 [Streptomyces sp. NPDC079189]|uniref:hypothetical protein n=1 Tax=Streptomyces sp. NPDC079189 TaxID=3154514 RepID=UPI00343EE580